MWILPTHGRPDRCQATLDSIMESGVSSGGCIVQDDCLDNRYWPFLRKPTQWSTTGFGYRRGVCGILNWALNTRPDEPWYGFISDDSIVKTPGWDTRLIEAAGTDGFANSADGMNSGLKMHGAVVFGGDMLRRLGWWALPGLQHSFCDDVWERIGRACGNWTYCPDVMVEHQHVFNGKAPNDATYEKAYESFDADKVVFDKWAGSAESDISMHLVNSILQRPLAARANSRAQRSSVMFCTPVYRDCSWQFTRALVDTTLTLQRSGIYSRCQMVIGNSNLPRARNELVAEFLASDCQTLMFVDSDMGWVPNDILRLLASDKPVIGGVGRKRCDAPNSDPNVWCAWFLDQEAKQDDAGALECGGVGTGFLKIDRSVFEVMIAAHPERKRRPLAHMSERVGAQFYDFFRFADGPEGECIGEDFHFCANWRKLGGTVWIDPEINLTHVGAHSYSGTIGEIFEKEAV